MRATLSRNGRKTTTRVARIRRSTTRHRRPLPPNSPQQAITLRSVMAPRAGLLLTPPERAYSCRDSNPRWGIPVAGQSRSNVLFPAPLEPITPKRSPGLKVNETPSRIVFTERFVRDTYRSYNSRAGLFLRTRSSGRKIGTCNVNDLASINSWSWPALDFSTVGGTECAVEVLVIGNVLS